MTLLPEKLLSLSPQLAATLGLEEALLYQLLGDIQYFSKKESLQGAGYIDIPCADLANYLPFWSPQDIRRISASLRDKGVLSIVSSPFGSDATFSFYLVSSTLAPEQQTQGQPPVGSSRLLSPQWQPARDIVAQLQQYGIPGDFIQAQVVEFTTYWSERAEPRHSWHAKFLKHVLRLWREEETRSAQRSREIPMAPGWRPSKDAIDLLSRQAGINPNFIEDAIPEFILYWKERGDLKSTWNSDFVRHVKIQWARFTATLENDSEPRAIARDWQPSEDLFEVLQLANIPRHFAQRQIPEFVLFWRESGQIHNSWNTKFLQHVKRQWARDGARGEQHNETYQGSGESIRTRDRSLVQDLTDRSWAN